MSDQVTGMIRDSDIKFECRLLITAIENLGLTEGDKQILYEIVHNILVIENKRLDALAVNK